MTGRRPYTVWLGYVANPVTTAVYLERALRKLCRVITVGPTMPLEMCNAMGIQHPLVPLDIETSFMPDMQALLAALPKEDHPDLYLWVDSVGRFSHLPQHLEALPCPTACYLIDAHFNPEYYWQYAAAFDYLFVAQLHVLDFFRAQHRQSYWLPLACDPDLHRDHGISRMYPVGFVGGMNNNRERLLTKVVGVAPVQYERCYLEDMARLFSASKIGFNHASLDDLNMRFFELPSTGALQLFSQTVGSGQQLLFKDGEEIVIYSEENLAELVSYYLEHDSLREQIAQRAKLMVHTAHTYDHRVEDLLSIVFDNKQDSFSPDELRSRSLQFEQTDRDAQRGECGTINLSDGHPPQGQPFFRCIVSNRGYSDWPSWLMVYEWEDLLARVLGVSVLSYDAWEVSRGRGDHATGYELCFLQLAASLDRFPHDGRFVPVVMDVWRKDIEHFIQQIAQLELVFVTSLEAFRILQGRGCRQVAYLPYSFPDQYLLEELPEKDVDIIQFGRTNPVLDDYMRRLLQRFPLLNYVTTEHHQGALFFHSSRFGLLNASDTRSKFITMLRRSSISLVSTAGMDGSRDTGGFDPVSPRFYESLGCFCRLIGRFPETEEFELLGMNTFAERVDSYQQFERLVTGYLGRAFDRKQEYQAFLRQHTTSARAVLLENALHRVRGVRADSLGGRQ
ncbi:MAG: glycosyltransferase [Trichlorobacter sp.]|uniref:glycosyltransferase family protein n=1 Tax=Trichlorobacter sp. TaxID=2911007 RepID=UPI002560E9CF|nr:glycosyltransferase [Trichlorobacter sp.]MDK9717036.1 glycosyltransferase [Trichlorobacter sp.]